MIRMKQSETSQPKNLPHQDTAVTTLTRINTFFIFHTYVGYIFYIGNLSEITLSFDVFHIGHKWALAILKIVSQWNELVANNKIFI